ncbi:hypothetical protein CI238_09972 [Colletotrichum incanum]|uniref:Uncharacterized protein n=1 Tax=Colletotrichum incanum TaxID=1573173 RepID=A0A161W4P0_COLIC|nr:hypothetical protein CI238_09972 [Colletotrichum incanum]
MAVTVEERFDRLQGALMAASAAAAAAISDSSAASNAPFTTKRRAASSPATGFAKRRKSSDASLKSRNASNPSLRRCKSSSPIIPALPVQITPDAPYTGAPTLTRTYHDFSHFLRVMNPGVRQTAFEEIKDTRLSGEERWRNQHYNPLYATEACKIAFLIQAESPRHAKSRQDALGEGKNKSKIEEPEMREYACYRCYTLQPKAAFEDKPPPIVVSSCGRLSMHDGARDLPVMRQGERLLRRYCIECGIKDGLYPDRALITSKTGDKWWVCECRHLHWVPPNEPYIECRRCLGKSGFRALAPGPAGSLSAGRPSP